MSWRLKSPHLAVGFVTIVSRIPFPDATKCFKRLFYILLLSSFDLVIDTLDTRPLLRDSSLNISDFLNIFIIIASQAFKHTLCLLQPEGTTEHLARVLLGPKLVFSVSK